MSAGSGSGHSHFVEEGSVYKTQQLAYLGFETGWRTGELETALRILREEESFWKDREDQDAKDALQRTYGKQALILQDWGRLEEALALHKKEEALCLELANKASLGYCYWNWGLLAREQKDRDTEREKLQSALQIFTELNMPRERDAVQDELEKTSKPTRSTQAKPKKPKTKQKTPHSE